MDKSHIDWTLYLCTDRDIMTCETVERSVELAAQGGCSVVQLREKNSSSREFLQLAQRVKPITRKYNIPLIINDRLDIALLSGADGVHLGQSDLPCSEVRRISGDELIIGVSAATAAEAEKAQSDGADYIGVGAMYPTATKTNTRPVTIGLLKEIRSSVNIPIVAIGGITYERIDDFRNTGINGFAVVSAILAQQDICLAAKQLREKILTAGL